MAASLLGFPGLFTFSKPWPCTGREVVGSVGGGVGSHIPQSGRERPSYTVWPAMAPQRVRLVLNTCPYRFQGHNLPLPLCQGRNFLQPFLGCMISSQRFSLVWNACDAKLGTFLPLLPCRRITFEEDSGLRGGSFCILMSRAL